ncbi:MAG: SRPBCC family protein [Actinobacteria bacterium]|nr:SRPBCC family protein [Actinomycetota bacterium]
MAGSDPKKIVSVNKVVAATPQQIFDLLADPKRHADIDGSGSVKAAQSDAPARLSLGAKFGMDMKIGAPYKITNEVVEFDEGKRIAWRHFGGHVWRYILEPTDGGTLVTEQFDFNGSKSQLMLRAISAPGRNKQSMIATLDRLAKLFA